MAATAPLEIEIYASFPHAVVLGAELNVDLNNWHWVHCLTLPLETLNACQFSQRPYKWIRYAIGVVVGAEGDLSSSPDSLNIVNYNAGLPAESTILYYHCSDEEKRRMFPVDPDIGRTNITSSVSTTRRDQFRQDVAQRDGGTCVLTGIREVFCEAVHLLPHSKGDTYIMTYTQHRSRDTTGGDIVQDIDSIQNGLFLDCRVHRVLGKDVAFLMTPNFAMNTDDIDPTTPPAVRRCTVHDFQPALQGGGLGVPSGSPLRMSNSDWPFAIIFDAVYAGTVLHHFGTQALKDEIAKAWRDTFYPGGITNTGHADYKAIRDERTTATERAQKQAQDRDARHEARSRPDTFDMLMTLPYILVPRNELQAMLRAAKEKAEAVEQRNVQDKVDTWNRQVAAA